MEWLKKLSEREMYVPLIVVAVVTVAWVMGKVQYSQWSALVEIMTGISVGSLTVRKAAASIGKK